MRAEHLALELAEPGTQLTVKVQLTDAPAGTVTVPLSSSDPSEGSVQPAELVFDAENWSEPQVVTVRAVDDGEADGLQPWTLVVGPMRSTDDRWDGFDPPDLSVSTWDDERGALVVTALSGELGEWGTTATFTVALGSAPAADVTVAVSPNDATEGGVLPAQLVFSKHDWRTPRLVTVQGADDFALDGKVSWQVKVSAQSADPAWSGVEASVDAATNDDDRPGFQVKGLAGAVNEAGGQATFLVVLDAEPSADVALSVTSSDATQATVAPAVLVFGPGDWQTPQLVTVIAVDDDRDEGDRTVTVVVGPVSSSEAGWADLSSAQLPFVVTDDDRSGYIVSALTGAITEAGGEASFTVHLEGPPEAEVTLPVRTSDATEATVSPAQLVFSPSNWQIPQTITLTGVDDEIDDGDVIVSAVFGPTTTNDPGYRAVSPPRPTGARNRDDDTAGLVVSALVGALTEAGGTATLTVRLLSEPTANVTLPVSSSDITEATVAPASLVFTATNWQSAQTVTVTGVDDSVVDGDQPVRVVLEALTSPDAVYAGRDLDDQGSTVADDDAAGITVSSVIGQPTEAGGTATFTVRLESQPTANVTLPLASSDASEGTVSPAALVFTPASWSTPRTVTITGVNDSLDDGDVAFLVRFSPATSADLNYLGRDLADVSVSTADDDEAGFVASTVTGQATEAGGQATFTLKLRTQPGAPVTFALSTSDAAQASAAPASLTFTTANWNTAQAVTVSAADDATDDGDVAVLVGSAPAVSTDPSYDGLQLPGVSVTTVDDDTRGLQVAAPTGSPTEAGGAVVYLLQLHTPPTADVTFPLTSGDLSEGTVSPASVTFTPTDWHTAQQVTVTGVDDEIDDEATTFALRIGAAVSQDQSYAGFDPVDPVVHTSDDDLASIVLAAATATLETTEGGGEASFTVKLATEPAADVVIAVSSDDSTEATVTPATLTFTAGDWSTPRTVIVRGVDDGLDDGDQPFNVVISAPTTADAVYAALDAPDFVGANVDDDTAGIFVSAVSGATTEKGGTTTFSVRLHTQPSANVTIALATDDATEGTVSISSLTFTPMSWSQPQEVTVTGADDDVVDGDGTFHVVLGAAVSTDALYSGVDPADVTLTTTDDDAASVVVSTLTGTATEAGGTTSFTVRLAAMPASDVTIAVSTNDASEGAVSPALLTFTSSTWSAPQTVTVTGEDDAIDDGAVPYQVVLGAAASLDPSWAGVDAADVAVATADDDVAGVSVSAASSTSLPEANGSATFTVVLDSQPTADVTFTVSTSDATEGTPSVASLVFTAASWNQSQTITVNAVDDAIDDGDQGFNVVLSGGVSADGSYSGVDPAARSFTTLDDDAAGIKVSALSNSLAEAGGAATFIVALDSQPTADVVISLSSSDPSEGAPLVASLTFTAANWTQAQAVTVNAVDDALDDGDVDFTIELAAAASGDTRYAGLDAADVSARTLDDDTPGVSVSAASGPVSEAGTTADFIVRLEAQPTDDVTIPVASTDLGEGTVAVTNLIFTPANWQTAQTVTVTGVDDGEDDGDVAFAIELGLIASGDTAWANLDPADVSMMNTDDDTVGVVATPTTGLVTSEGGGAATFTVQLASQPVFDVTVAVTSTRTGEGTVDPASLTFTALNWNTPRTVTITGVQDFDLDADAAYGINLVATSTDPKYHGRGGPVIGVTNTNDDFSCDPLSATTVWSSGTYRYATIDCGLRDGSTSGGTTGWWKVPSGWGLAPNDADAQLAAGSFPWSTDVLVFADGTGWATTRSPQPGVWGSNVLFADAGGGYNVGALNGRVFIRQFDPSALVVSPASGLVTTEGRATATFTVRLASQPWSDVTVAVGSGDSTEGAASPASLSFTSSTWSTPQTVTVTGAVDTDLDSDVPYVVGLSSSSSDPSYQGRAASVAATNRNDDFVCNPAAPEQFILRGGYRYASIDCVTTTQATAGTMTGFFRAVPGWEIAPDDDDGRAAVDARPWGAEYMYIGAGVLRTTSLHGTPGINLGNSWPTTEGPGFKFPGLNARVLVRQQDPEGFVVTPTTGLVTRENGVTASFTVKLAQAPVADVTVPVASSDTTEGTVSPTTLTFTSANWNVAQTVTVTGVDDADADGAVAYTLTLGPAVSGDPTFQGKEGPLVRATNQTDECDPLASPTTSVEGVGVRYATLDCVEVNSPTVSCQQGFWRVPAGWELAPEETESESAIMDNNWGTHVVVLELGAGWRTRLGAQYDGQIGLHSVGNLTTDGQGRYGVIGCELRVLVRQRVP